MTTITACDVLPDMVIRTAFDAGRPYDSSGNYSTGVATFRVASVEECDGTVYIHADSKSSRVFEVPDSVRVQVLRWPSYSREDVDTDPEVLRSWHEAAELEADNEALKKAMAEDDGTRIPFRAVTQDGLVNASVPKVDVERYFQNIPSGARDDAAKSGFKTGGVLMTADEVEAAVERALRRQESKASNPSNTRVIDAAGRTAEQVVAEAKAAMRDGEWTLKSVTPSKPKHPANGGK